MGKAHRTYFMNQKIYDIVKDPILNEEPFNKLIKENWLEILYHLNAHEIEAFKYSTPIVPRGNLLDDILNSDNHRLFFYRLIDDYFSQNNVASSCYSGQPVEFFSEKNLLPFKELHLYEKALELWNEFKDYEVVSLGVGRGYDIQKKKVA